MEKTEKSRKKWKKILNAICGIVGVAGLTALVYHLAGEEDSGEDIDRWIKSLSDEELDLKREATRQDWCSSGGDIHKAVRLESLLDRFDNEMADRALAKMPKEYKPPRHREHGWYLDNDN